MFSPPAGSAPEPEPGPAKPDLRARLLARRRELGQDERARGSAAICSQLLALPEVLSARCVAAYAAVGAEPSVEPALDQLAARGVRVLLPVLQEGLDLDWAERPSTGQGGLVPSAVRPRLLEPVGTALGERV